MTFPHRGLASRPGAVWFICLAGVALVLSACGPSLDPGPHIRPSTATGTYYPEQSPELAALLSKAFRAAPETALRGEVKAILVPHAAVTVSGVVAAAGLRLLQARPLDTVYVIGSEHFADVGGAITWAGQAVRTPLGAYPLDVEAVRELLRSPDIHLYPAGWTREYSVDVQIPFLQTVAPQAHLVPLAMGSSTWDECWAVARALANQARRRTSAIVISTDLAHFPRGADATTIDRQILRAVEAFDPYQLDHTAARLEARGLPQVECAVCGLAGLKTGMLAAALLGANRAVMIQYANSGDITGKKDRVVGYAAVAFYQDPSKPSLNLQPRRSPETPVLSESVGRELLDLAGAAIQEGLATGKRLKPVTTTPELLERGGLYVTLRRAGQLRGSAGMPEPRLPLVQAVARMGFTAAFQDRRFPPLTDNEWKDTEIVISVLSPLRRLGSAGSLEPGRQGVMVRREGRQAVLLPDATAGRGWTRNDLLTQVCRKAGLPDDAWRDTLTEILVFTTQRFSRTNGKTRRP